MLRSQRGKELLRSEGKKSELKGKIWKDIKKKQNYEREVCIVSKKINESGAQC
jgi:hypothetical protein